MSHRQCSPTFRPALASIGAGVGNPPFSVYADNRDGPTPQRTQARAPARRASSIGWCDGLREALREGQAAPKIPSNKGLRSATSPRTIREFQYSRVSENALLSAGSCVRSAAQGWNPAASHPRKAKRSSARQLAVSPNSRAEPVKLAIKNGLMPVRYRVTLIELRSHLD